MQMNSTRDLDALTARAAHVEERNARRYFPASGLERVCLAAGHGGACYADEHGVYEWTEWRGVNAIGGAS